MAKKRSTFICQQCESHYPSSYGRCPNCGAWDSLVETVETVASPSSVAAGLGLRSRTPPRSLAAVDTASWGRQSTGGVEFDRVLGGGLVPGSLVLLGGDPGIGKSTLLAQVCMAMARSQQVLYVTGEESTEQVRLRADRLGAIPPNLLVMPEIELGAIISTIEEMLPSMVVIDSIQTMQIDDLSSSAGSVGQVRECATRLMHVAKRTHVPIFLVGHVTKEGTIAGPRVLEHIVDTVLYLEGDRFHAYRLLRSVKNRFGSTNEVGVFEMSEDGLREVANPSAAFLAERGDSAPGSTVTVTVEGTRPLLIEIQALVSPTGFRWATRTSTAMWSAASRSVSRRWTSRWPFPPSRPSPTSRSRPTWRPLARWGWRASCGPWAARVSASTRPPSWASSGWCCRPPPRSRCAKEPPWRFSARPRSPTRCALSCRTAKRTRRVIAVVSTPSWSRWERASLRSDTQRDLLLAVIYSRK